MRSPVHVLRRTHAHTHTHECTFCMGTHPRGALYKRTVEVNMHVQLCHTYTCAHTLTCTHACTLFSCARIYNVHTTEFWAEHACILTYPVSQRTTLDRNQVSLKYENYECMQIYMRCKKNLYHLFCECTHSLFHYRILNMQTEYSCLMYVWICMQWL